VDYKAPVPSGSWICVTVDLVSVEGRKVRLAARVTSSHEEDATLFASATCLFIVAAKD
jgi:predicted thioesterase